MSLRGRRSMIKGMGSGDVRNQRLAGSVSPEDDANLATNKITEQDLEDRNSKIEEIKEAFKNGFPEVSDEKISRDLDSVYSDYQKWMSDEVDKEIEEEYNIQRIQPDDPLYNPISDISRRSRIEKTLEPISFDDMIFKGYCEQDIKLREGFVICLRSITTQQGLWIEQELSSFSDESLQYGRHYFSLRQIACSLQSINGKSIGVNLHKYKKLSDKQSFLNDLKDRFEFVTNLPQEITDDLIIQFVWFSGRIRKCLAGDIGKKLGN